MQTQDGVHTPPTLITLSKTRRSTRRSSQPMSMLASSVLVTSPRLASKVNSKTGEFLAQQMLLCTPTVMRIISAVCRITSCYRIWKGQKHVQGLLGDGRRLGTALDQNTLNIHQLQGNITICATSTRAFSALTGRTNSTTSPRPIIAPNRSMCREPASTPKLIPTDWWWWPVAGLVKASPDEGGMEE